MDLQALLALASRTVGEAMPAVLAVGLIVGLSAIPAKDILAVLGG